MIGNYDEYWSSLRTSHGSHPANIFRYRLIAAEIARLGIHPQRIVDCGCGDGGLLAEILARVPAAEIYGMDISAAVPANAPGSPIRFAAHDLGTPVPEELRGRFDLVLCSEVIEHVADDSMVLRNIYDLAAPGAWIVITTQTGRIYRTEEYLGHLRHYDLSKLSARAENTGLKIRKAYRCGWPFLNLQKIAAHAFQGSVQKRIIQADRLSLGVRAVFFVLRHLYRLSARTRGPQLIILATRP